MNSKQTGENVSPIHMKIEQTQACDTPVCPKIEQTQASGTPVCPKIEQIQASGTPVCSKIEQTQASGTSVCPKIEQTHANVTSLTRLLESKRKSSSCEEELIAESVGPHSLQKESCMRDFVRPTDNTDAVKSPLNKTDKSAGKPMETNCNNQKSPLSECNGSGIEEVTAFINKTSFSSPKPKEKDCKAKKLNILIPRRAPKTSTADHLVKLTPSQVHSAGPSKTDKVKPVLLEKNDKDDDENALSDCSQSIGSNDSEEAEDDGDLSGMSFDDDDDNVLKKRRVTSVIIDEDDDDMGVTEIIHDDGDVNAAELCISEGKDAISSIRLGSRSKQCLQSALRKLVRQAKPKSSPVRQAEPKSSHVCQGMPTPQLRQSSDASGIEPPKSGTPKVNFISVKRKSTM